jgi:PAS domain S-box-containing protein
VNYGVAIAATGLALLLTLWLEPILSRTLGAFFYVAVIISTWYGGLTPGIVATIFSVLAINYFFIPPVYQLQVTHFEDLLRLVIFSLVALIINLFNTDLRNSKRRIEKLNRQITQENADRLQMVLMAAQVGLWDWNLTTGEIDWSPEHEQLFGLAPGTFDGRYETFDACLHPDDRSGLEAVIRESIQERKLYQHEFRIVWADGSVHWIEGRGRMFYSSSDQPERMLGTAMNIGRRKQAELELKQAKEGLEQAVLERTAALSETNQQLEVELLKRQTAEAKLQEYVDEVEDLYDNAPCGYHSLDAAGKFIRINHTELTWLGYDRHEILGQPFTNLLTPDSLTVFQANFPKFMRQGWIHALEFNLICKDGSILPVILNATALKDATGNFIMSRSTITDIRERQQVEEALRTSELKFRLLSESSPIGVFMADANGKNFYTNPRAQEICGFSFEEALGDGWMNFIHPDDLQALTLRQMASRQAQTADTYEEVRHVHKDGMIRYGRVRTAPVFSSDGNITGHVGTIEDVTEIRAIAQMKNEFISVVSHELRTPLTALRGSLGLLAHGVYDKNPEKGKRMLQVAAESTDRLARLVSDILDLERLESGKVKLVQERCDAGALMLQATEGLRDSATQNQIRLVVIPIQATLWASPDSIIQTLTNLLSNAIKFSEADSTIWLQAKVCQENEEVEQKAERRQYNTGECLPVGADEGSYVLFSVKDQGRGIPANQLETIFGHFQQVDVSDSRQKGGTGLGLAICRSIIQQQGGKIWAESIIGEGSTFYFTLPCPPEETELTPN